MLAVTGCVHRYDAVTTELVGDDTWTHDLKVGDVVRVGLTDGTSVEGNVRWMSTSSFKIGDSVVLTGDVAWLQKRRIRPIGVVVVGVTVVAVAAAVVALASLGDSDWGR